MFLVHDMEMKESEKHITWADCYTRKTFDIKWMSRTWIVSILYKYWPGYSRETGMDQQYMNCIYTVQILTWLLKRDWDGSAVHELHLYCTNIDLVTQKRLGWVSRTWIVSILYKYWPGYSRETGMNGQNMNCIYTVQILTWLLKRDWDG